MALIADILLGAGAVGAALYCLVLSRRLSRFTQLESGMGGAIAVLSAQVDDMTRALQAARETAGESSRALGALIDRAEKTAARLEIVLATMHDLPDTGGATMTQPAGRKLRVVHRRSRSETMEPAE